MAKPYRPVALDEQPFLSPYKSDDEASEGKGSGSMDDEKFAWKADSREDDEPRGIFQTLRRKQRLGPGWVWLGHAVLLSISLTLFALSFCSKKDEISDDDYTKKFSAWSPALSAVKYETQNFDLPPIAEGPFIGAGDDVDERWEYISRIGDTMISRQEMLDLGLNPDISLAITDPRNGKPGYRVAIEVFHQLHCLNLLRQDLYKDYYAPLGGDTADEPEELGGHLNHCIDALRQFIMCQGDVGVFSFNYPYNDGDPWPDYTTPHTCRNFESIRQWAVEHTVPRGPDEPEH